MQYFAHITDADTLKTEYRRLCKKLHSDKGGNDAEFIAMQAEYSQRLEEIEAEEAERRENEQYERDTDGVSMLLNTALNIGLHELHRRAPKKVAKINDLLTKNVGQLLTGFFTK